MRTDVLGPAQGGSALVPSDGQPSIESHIAQWLHAKGQRSQSLRTVKEYAAVLGDFRAEIQRRGFDLDASDVQAIGRIVQAWAARARRRDGRPVAPATHNRRLAIVSSFFGFAKRHDMLDAAGAPIRTPVELVERAQVQAYAAARPLDAGDVATRLGAIDRAVPAGKRDYALLSIALSTGRRLSELAALRWSHVTLSQGRATLTWERTKGGKQMHDRLPLAVTDALLQWLSAAYGADLATLAPDAPLWLGLAPNVRGQRRPLSIDAIADIAQKHLGTSKMHVTRHSFAVAMERAGAKLTDIQTRLGHSAASTTSLYLQRLHAAENAYAEDVAALFGIQSPRPRAARVTRPLDSRRRRVSETDSRTP